MSETKTKKPIEFKDLLSKIETTILYAIIFLVPIFFLPLFPNPYVTAKIALLTFGLGTIIILKSIRLLLSGSFKASIGSFDIILIFLAAIYAISGYVQTPNRLEAFFLPGNASITVLLTILYFLINQLNDKGKLLIQKILLLSGVVIAFISLISISGVFESLKSLPVFMQQSTFTPLGGILPTAILLIACFPFALNLLINEKSALHKVIWGVSASLLAFGLIVSIFNINNASINLPSYSDSWSIAIDSIKESPALGIGPGNYLSAFNLYRPVTYNQNEFWTLRFTSAKSFYLTLVTETGLLGLVGLLTVTALVYKLAKKSAQEKKLVGWSSSNNTALISLSLLAFLLLFFPATLTLIFMLYVLLALNSKTSPIELNFSHSSDQSLVTKLPSIVLTTPIILLIGATFIYSTRLLQAESLYAQSLRSVANNDGATAYDQLQETINKNPLIDRYHITYAQINLALANAIIQNLPEGEQLSAEDQSTVSQLIQQSIREGKSAVSLNPQRAGNWELLGTIYKNVIPLARGADVFAAQTLNQAVALDPLNTETRISLGGILYAQQNYESAIDIFKLAVATKQDHANAHYNLAIAYRENGQINQSTNEMSIVLSLLERDTDDYQVAKEILETLQQQQAAAAEELKATETLTPPPAQAPVTEEESQIDLTEQEAPPAPEESPEPTPLP